MSGALVRGDLGNDVAGPHAVSVRVGSVTPTVPSRETVIWPLQLVPRSVDRSTATVPPCCRAVVVVEDGHDVDEVPVAERDDLVADRLVVLTWIKDRPGGSQLDPPLVVRENHVGPRNAAVFRYDLPCVRSFGNTSRSQTA